MRKVKNVWKLAGRPPASRATINAFTGCFQPDVPGTYVVESRTMAEAARDRPPDYASLPPAEQWAIDKRLGILDWDGT